MAEFNWMCMNGNCSHSMVVKEGDPVPMECPKCGNDDPNKIMTPDDFKATGG